MKPDELQQLRVSLIHQGYSRRYVRRLLDELNDHSQCVADEDNRDGSNHDLASRIGTAAEITAAIHQRPELKPLPNRRPLTIFVILPVLGLFLLSLATVQIFDYLAHRHDSSPGQPVRDLVAMVQQTLKWVPLWIAGLAGFLAARARVAVLFPLATGIVMSATAAHQIDVGFCAISQTMVCHQHWQMDLWQIGFTAGALGIGYAFSRFLDRATTGDRVFSGALERAES